MAEKLVVYPEVNPLQMVPQSDPDFLLTTKYKYPHYNNWWQCERRAMHEPYVHYKQKIQQTDRLILVFHSNNGGTTGANFKFYNMDWTDTGVAVGVANTSVSGFEITSEVSNTVYTAYTHIVDQSLQILGLADGYYFGVMEVPYGSGDSVYYVSEPIYLRDQHPSTKLLEYSNTVNNFDVFFHTHSVSFQLRVESHLHSLTPNSIDTTFEDELVDITLLDSIPYNTYTWAARAIPEWMVNKVNRAFSCDLLRWEGKYFTKDKDAKFDMVGGSNEPLKGMSIAVRPAKNLYSQQNIFVDPILVYTILNNGDSNGPTRFPYFLKTATLNRTGAPSINLLVDINGVNTIGAYTTNCMEIRDTSDELLVLNYCNLDRKPYHGQLGSYSGVTNGSGDYSLYYYPHATEQNYITSTWMVLSKPMIIRFQGAYGSGQYYDVKGSHIGYGLVRQNNTHASAAYGNGNPGITYLVGGSSINIIGDQARLYHYDQQNATDTVFTFKAIYPALTPNIREVAGKYPESLIDFQVTSGLAFDTVLWQYFVPCKANLVAVSFYKNNVSLVQGMDVYLPSLDLLSFVGYDLSWNVLTPSGVDDVFNQMWNGGGGAETFTQTNGEMYTDNQNPPAPPTPASAVAVSFIDNFKAWLVVTD